MSVVAQVTESSGNSYRVLSKGAPEVLCDFMKDLPNDYKDTYLSFVKDGARVLALGYKNVQKMSH